MPQPVLKRDTTKATDLAAQLRGFGVVGIAGALLVAVGAIVGGSFFPPLRGGLVVLWAWVSGTPGNEIGYVQPKNWLRTIAGAIVLGAAFKTVMKAVVMPLLGADPINHAYHFLVGNTLALPVMVFTIIVGAGFGEESLFRGFAFERLRKLLGTSAVAKVSIVLITSAIFAALHYSEQGLAGMEQAAITGLVFGTVYARTGRLSGLMIAHAAFDLVAVAIIYWDVEYTVAHLIFR